MDVGQIPCYGAALGLGTHDYMSDGQKVVWSNIISLFKFKMTWNSVGNMWSFTPIVQDLDLSSITS